MLVTCVGCGPIVAETSAEVTIGTESPGSAGTSSSTASTMGSMADSRRSAITDVSSTGSNASDSVETDSVSSTATEPQTVMCGGEWYDATEVIGDPKDVLRFVDDSELKILEGIRCSSSTLAMRGVSSLVSLSSLERTRGLFVADSPDLVSVDGLDQSFQRRV
jgi:hypothetical protein